MITIWLLLLLSIASVALSQNVGSIIETGTMMTMKGLFNTQEVSDLKAQLGQDKMTLFCPTDEAFKKIPDGWLQLIKKDSTILRRFLQLHTISGTAIRSRDIDSSGGSRVLIYASDEGTRLDMSLLNGVIQVTTPSQAVASLSQSLDGTAADNGVIHYLDSIIFSQTMNLPDDSIRENPNIPRTYATALSLSGMDNRAINGEFKDLSILAPSDAAFAFRDITSDSLASWPKEHIESFVRYTFLGQFYSQKYLQSGASDVLGTRLDSNIVTLSANKLNGEQGSSAVITYNTTTTEGIIYVTDTLLLPLNFEIPQSSVLDAGRLPSMYSAAVSYSGLRSTALAKNITFFSPSDDAFAAAGITGDNFDDYGKQTMRKIVLFCMVKGYYDVARLRATTAPLQTLDNETIVIDNRGSTLFVHSTNQKSELTEVRVATDGIIHVTNELLLPVGVSLDTSNSNSLTTLDVILVSSLAAICCVGGLCVLHKGSIGTYLQDRQKELAEQEARVGKELLKDQEVKIALGKDYNGFRALGEAGELPAKKEIPQPLPEIREPSHLNQRALENIESGSRSSLEIPSNSSSNNNNQSNFLIDQNFQFPRKKSAERSASLANSASVGAPFQKTGDGANKTGDSMRPDTAPGGPNHPLTRSSNPSMPLPQGRGRRVQLPRTSPEMW
eukprot:TRINITY_DN5399_c4_g1_i1.p1 TRINITY_DN5399_c4_g1~~TRINITY_DN5399_c4_g1_i1.p1  ORF type:complete len:670 (+),score=139.11 TRINITY_DN5399_c4_g1_i1:130-2139(+)